ncbi:hypothetical protein BASA81_000946 [Batrachochytrium salamandrivorans]|nr:hypothetical protein BASA81_000946 [Batrachochytrium salamandrivorans]
MDLVGLDDAHRRLKELRVKPPAPPPPPANRLHALAADKSEFFLEMQQRRWQQEESSCGGGGATRLKKVPLQVAMEQGNRMYQESFKKQDRLQRQQQQQSVVKEPVTRSVVLNGTVPLHERAEQICQQREQALNRLRVLRREQELLAKPAAVAVDSELVTNRLLDKAQALEAKKQRDKELALEATRNQGTPHINPYSRELTRKSHGTLSFLDRQERISQQLESKALERQQQHQFSAQKQEGTVVLSPDQANQMVTRLAEETAVSQAKRKHAKQEEYFASKYPFRPTIDAHSHTLAPSGSGGTLALFHNQQAHLRKQALKHKLDQEAMKECTFRPALSAPPAALYGSRSQHEWQRRGQEKLEKIERVRFEQKMKEAEECTFRPHVHPAPPPPTVPADEAIKGMAGHLLRQRVVEERRLEQKQREEKAFLINLPPHTRRYTVAQPFRLSVGGGARREHDDANSISTAGDEDNDFDY